MRRGLAFAALLLSSIPSRADVEDVRTHVETVYKQRGALVTTLPARFVYEGETVVIPLPDMPQGGCVTVAFVAARGLSFHAKVGDELDLAQEPSSIAGVLDVSLCDSDRPRTIHIKSDAGRGALETIIGYSRAPLPPLTALLPERTGGALPPIIDPGPPPPIAPVAKRADAAEARAKRDGATLAPRTTVNASADGSGSVPIVLPPGCHSLELFSSDPKGQATRRKGRVDVDAEIRNTEDDVLARDRSDAADAQLDTCVGDRTNAVLSFVGALGGSPLLVTHASWAIPATLPHVWGETARGRMAGALLAHHIASPALPAVFLTSGPSGISSLPVTIEPGGCYIAVVVGLRGTVRGVGVRASVGARETADDRGTEGSALISFCAYERDTAMIEVSARGVSMMWGLALFHAGSGIWEMNR